MSPELIEALAQMMGALTPVAVALVQHGVPSQEATMVLTHHLKTRIDQVLQDAEREAQGRS